ncbi:MAG: hydroxyacid dehydrogenase [Elusimicrobia bacterium RIFOXYD12_FULL_66_9]|nr:MAG: hydroxyacid dehydrogenase [Elusimicrobia bacterium RIFOXYD12_FULL_66_9]
MSSARGYAAPKANAPLTPFTFARREPGDSDIRIEISHCGICHSDIHQARDEWGGAVFPMVPGHEIVGRVTHVGRRASKFKVGETAGVGCLVDTCRSCENCGRGLEQHCLKHPSFTYNGTEQDGKTPTYGGYSDSIVVDEDYALKVAAGLPPERVAPLLCAGITTYSPLKRWGAGKGKRVGVLGLGGLGHMAVKIAAAMGAEVTVLSGSASKKPDASRLGAADFVLTSDAAALKKTTGRLDLVVDTVSAAHDVNSVLGLLKTEGTMVMVGASPAPLAVATFPLIVGRRNLAGSLIGGIAETQEMLDFCAKEKVLSDVEVVAAKEVNTAYERMLKGDVRYRFVIDLKTL